MTKLQIAEELYERTIKAGVFKGGYYYTKEEWIKKLLKGGNGYPAPTKADLELYLKIQKNREKE